MDAADTRKGSVPNPELYALGKIYALNHKPTKKVYYGSTVQTLIERLQGHWWEADHGDISNSDLYKLMRETKREEWTMALFKNYPCNSMSELVDEEIRVIGRACESSELVLNHTGRLAPKVHPDELAVEPLRHGGLVVKTQLKAEEVRQLQEILVNRLAPNTRRTYECAKRSFAKFCAERFPDLKDVAECTAEQVALFLMELSKTKRVETVRHRMAAIKGFARNISADEWRKLGEVMAGIRRTLADTPQGAPGGKDAILTDDLKKMLQCVEGDGKEEVRDRALLLTLWFSAMRRSEVAALQWRDVEFKPSGCILTIRRSKTDQMGAGQHAPIHSKPQEPQRCAVAALLAWKAAAAPSVLTAPVFPCIYKGTVVEAEPMGDQRMYRLVKRLCDAAGMDKTKFGCHSFRSGFITQGAMQGVPITALQHQARHRSIESTALYTRQSALLAEDAPIRKM
jgi:integrase